MNFTILKCKKHIISYLDYCKLFAVCVFGTINFLNGQTCAVGTAVSSTGNGFIAWGGSAHPQNATRAILSSGSTLTSSNSAVLQDGTPLVIDMHRLVPDGATFTFAIQRFLGSGTAEANIEYSLNGTTWLTSGSGTGATGWSSNSLSTSSTTSVYINKTVPTGGLRYIRITSTTGTSNPMLVDGVSTTHYCPIPVSGRSAIRSFYAPGSNNGTLITNVYPANAQILQFTTIQAPSNGSWTLNSSTGAYSYTPNALFDGFEVGLYRVCDGGADGNLATTGDNNCDIDTFIMRAVFNCDTNVFFVPMPENEAMDYLKDIATGAAINNEPMNFYAGLSVTSDAIIVYDHWEDGYETNPRNPTQATTQIWGDGDLRNGIAPGVPSDILNAGQTMILQNQILNTGIASSHPTYNPNAAGADNDLQNIVDYDGKDRILIHGIGALAKFAWGTSSTLSVSGSAAPRTEYWGTNYVLPGGQNSANAGNNFEVANLSIMAEENGTTVNIDRDANGTVDVTVTLNMGETYYMDNYFNGSASTVNAGGTISANKKILVMYMTADAATNYQGRTYPLIPNSQLSTCYYVPRVYQEDVRVYMYNPSSSTTITVTRTSAAGSNTFILGPGGTASELLANGSDNGHRYCADGTNTFTMVAAVDPGSTASDWGFVPVSDNNLQNYLAISLGFGADPTSSAYPNNNYEQLLVTPVNDTYFYVDLDGDGNPDPFSINGNTNATESSVTIGTGGATTSTTYNETTSGNGVLVRALRTLSIGSTSGDLSGAVVWTKTTANNGPVYGSTFAAVWGQNGGPGAAGNIDIGYTIPPKMFPPMSTSVRVRFPEVCPGSITDTIHFNIADGTGPYRMQWINTSTGISSVYNFTTDSTKIPGIAAGTYLIKIRDNNCLNYQTTITITEKTTGCPGNIGDLVWNDLDKDGVQDPGEPSLAGITLQLLNSSGVIVGTTISDASGKYLFRSIDPGNYSVRAMLPPNYGFTTQTNTVDNTNGTATKERGSDVNAITGQTFSVNVSSGELETNIDIGLVYNTPELTGAIGNYVWLDENNNGVQSSNEPGISGVTVTLYNNSGNPVKSTITDANGRYLFTDLPLGTYTVGFSLPPTMRFSPANQGGNDNIDSDPATSGLNFGRTASITLTSGTPQVLTVAAGMSPQLNTRASIGDKVWNDTDRDGIQDIGEPGIPGVQVELYDRYNNATLLATTITDALGNYIFNDLAQGDYKVKFTTPAGYVFSTQNSGSDDNIDSDVIPSTGFTQVYNLWGAGGLGFRELTVDAGMYNNTVSPSNVAVIGDRVWNDLNRDGVQASGENGIAGVTVQLFNSSGTLVATTLTNFNGLYQFVDVAPGTYSIRFSNIPEGYSISPRTQGGNTALDSDPDPATGFTPSFAVLGGNSYLDVDMGLIQGTPAGLGSIGSQVWYDTNQDGLQNNNETGAPNITVTLKQPGPDGIAGTGDDITVASKLSDALGNYMFEKLPAGAYFVEYGNLPTGFTRSPQNVGTNDNIDSDVPTTGAARTQTIQLATGEDNLTLDYGIYSTTTFRLGNYVWFDVNKDGQQGSAAAEPGIPGVMVTLLDGSGNIYDSDAVTAGIQPLVTTTNSSGYYMFNGLPAGSYSVLFSNIPAGYGLGAANIGNDATDSDPGNNGKTAAVTLNSGTPSNMTLAAGLVTNDVTALGDFVWFDTDGDGVQDAGEPGIPGVTVTIYNSAGTIALYSTITDQDGKYLFSNLSPNNYRVGFSTLPNNTEFTTADATTESLGTDSDVDPVTGLTPILSILANTPDLKIDAGIRQKQFAELGDKVWLDGNLDGLQSSSEGGYGGVVVKLFTLGADGIQGNSDDVLVSSAITNGDGQYRITNVPPGTNYYVTFSNHIIGTWTLQNIGGTGAGNNSKSDNTGMSTAFSIGANAVFLNFDAGLINVTPLPLNLLSFNAAKHNETQAKLTWTITTDEVINGFTVHRAINNAAFSPIGVLNVTPKLFVIETYEMIDASPSLSGSNFYRISWMNAAGKSEFSSIREVKFETTKNLSVVPNPASNEVTINFPDNNYQESFTMTITSMKGDVVLSKVYNTTSAVVDVSNIPQGVYQVQITSENRAPINTKLIINR